MTINLDALEKVAREAHADWASQVPTMPLRTYHTTFSPSTALALIAEVRSLLKSDDISMRAYGMQTELLNATRAERDALQAKLDNVRELHRKWTYYDHEDSCPDTSEEHREQRHHESDDIGEFYCEDMPTGEVVCVGCRDEFGERVDWPCMTIQALGGDAE